MIDEAAVVLASKVALREVVAAQRGWLAESFVFTGP